MVELGPSFIELGGPIGISGWDSVVWKDTLPPF